MSFDGKLLRGQEGRICIKICHSATWGKYISNTSLATRTANIGYTSAGLFTTTFISPSAHRSEKSLYLSKTTACIFSVLPWWEFQLGEIILLHSIVRTVPVKPGTSQGFRIRADCTPQEVVFVMGQAHSSCSKHVHWHISLACLILLMSLVSLCSTISPS